MNAIPPPLTQRKRHIPVASNAASVTPKSDNSETASNKPTLILFYNLQWGQPLDFDTLSLPPDCRWTSDHRYLAQADAIVFHIPDLGNISGLIKPPGQIWVAWSKESKLHYPRLGDAGFMRRFDLTMTYDRHSDIPVPYYEIDMLRALQSPPYPKTQTAPAALFVSSLVNQSKRLEYLAQLMQHLNVHSYGRQLNNMSLANDQSHRDKLAAIANYKFTLAFENAIDRDYVTEKFFDPLLVGSVPIYHGAPNIHEFAPSDHCFINVADFESPQKLAEYVLALAADDAAYNEYLAWRSKPLRADFVRMLESVREHPLARLYQRVREIRATQTVHAEPVTTEAAKRNATHTIAVKQPAIPKILHQTWKDNNIPANLDAYHKTWQTHHPDWEFKLWTDIDNREFIRQNYGWFLPIYDGYPENIMRADAVRYFILYHYGGVYADLDMECLQPLDPLLDERDIVFGWEPPAHANTPLTRSRGLVNIIGNAVMASTPNHPFWEHAFKQLVRFHRASSALDATGPFFLTYTCNAYAHREQISVASHELLYPISNEKPWGEVSPEVQLQIKQVAFTIHHSVGSWWREQVAQQAQQAMLTLLVQGQAINKMIMSIEQYRTLLASRPSLPKISCLMVTKNRTLLAKRAIHCFQQQTYPNRELVIIDDSPDNALEQWIIQQNDSCIVYTHLPDENRSLGELRNQAVSQATGDYIAQWDDDDLSDPQRLEIQMAVIHALQTDACFLERQQILWLATRRLAVSTRRIWEGSFLCAKAVLPSYPAQRQGEDTPVIEQVTQRGRVALLDLPSLYTYVFHGDNTFAADHWEKHWLMATESFEGPLFDAVVQVLQERLKLNLLIESANK